MIENKRRITADDLYKFELISGFQISPDGKNVVYAVQRVDQKTEKKFSNLWLIATEGGNPRQFTYGDQVDSNPQWSPDGSQIAFISNRKDEKNPQMYVIPFSGGEARPLTDLKGRFAAFEWSPDGQKFVCQFRKTDPEVLEREEDEQKKKLGVVERHYTRISYKFDGAGFLPKERWHIWVIDAQSGEATQLTDGEIYDEASPTWSPDSETILFTSNRSPDPDIDFDLLDLYTIPASGGEMQKIAAPEGMKMLPSFSPDGKLIAYLGREGREDWWKNVNLWVTPLDGSSPARDLTGKFDFHVAPDTMNDSSAGAAEQLPPTWSSDGQTLYFPKMEHGCSSVQSVSIDGEKLQAVTDGVGSVGAYGFDKGDQKLLYFYATITNPGQLLLKDKQSGEVQTLTNLNPWLDEIDLGEVEEVWFQGRDGNDLQGWVLKPPGFDPAQKYPSIFEIHGGPMGQYGHFFMHEFYFLAAQGYVVYFSNPRGGQRLWRGTYQSHPR